MKIATLVILAILIAFAFWVSINSSDEAQEKLSSSETEKPVTSTARTPPRKETPTPPSYATTRTVLPIAADTARLHSKEITPREDLEIINALLQWHRRANGSNPIGFNDEITAALTGDNLKGAVTLPKDHPAISESGELTDRWGTPYRFHALSSTLMEIISAGPDHQFNTDDDLHLPEEE